MEDGLVYIHWALRIHYVMPFGLASPSVFQFMINDVF